MAEIINLNRVRKQKARQEREAEAAANRRKFGRTGAEKKQDRLEREREAREIDGKKLDE